MSFKIHVMFDCYRGLDCVDTVSVVAKKAELRPVEEEVDDPDMHKPTFVDDIVTTLKGKEVDPDAELLEEEEDTRKPEETLEKPGKKKAGYKKGKKGREKSE